jgi:hypothetical protein
LLVSPLQLRTSTNLKQEARTMKFIVIALAMILSTAVMAKPDGGGDGGSRVFERAMAHNDAAMAAYRASK